MRHKHEKNCVSATHCPPPREFLKDMSFASLLESTAISVINMGCFYCNGGEAQTRAIDMGCFYVMLGKLRLWLFLNHL